MGLADELAEVDLRSPVQRALDSFEGRDRETLEKALRNPVVGASRLSTMIYRNGGPRLHHSTIERWRRVNGVG